MSLALAFRDLRESDGERLRTIHRRAVLERAASAITPEAAASWIEGLTADGYWQAHRRGEAFDLALVDGQVAAFCSRAQNRIVGLYVDPDHVARGIGRALLGRAEAAIAARGYAEAVVISSLHAVPFYQRLGFTIVEEAVRVTRGAVPMRLIDMRKPLAAAAPVDHEFHNMSYANRAHGTPRPSSVIGDLIALMAALRTPVTGCPWDLEQSFASIAPYTIEEAYEVADAIERGDFADLRDELGDLLLQVVYHARLAEEDGRFAFPDVVEAITAKLIRRHPHVFGDEAARSAGMAKGAWERIKAQERAARGRHGASSALDGVPLALPALTRAVKLQDKAGRVGFDWNDPLKVLDKVVEEAEEIRMALQRGDAREAGAEIGDLLFVIANLARHLQADPEAELRGTMAKFVRRFGHIERRLAEAGRKPQEATLAEMDRLWNEAKAKERQPPG